MSSDPKKLDALGDRLARELDEVLRHESSFAGADDLTRRLLVKDGIAPLARHLGMSARTLRRHCARAGLRLDVRRQALRRELVITLLATDLPVAEVAHRLGYASSQTLARFLKKSLGATATEVRQRMRPGRGSSVRPRPGETRPGIS